MGAEWRCKEKKEQYEPPLHHLFMIARRRRRYRYKISAMRITTKLGRYPRNTPPAATVASRLFPYASIARTRMNPNMSTPVKCSGLCASLHRKKIVGTNE